MPLDFRPLKLIHMSDLFGGRLEPFQVREHIHPDVTSPTARCLFDGRDYVWVYSKSHGIVTLITLFAGDALHILTAIETAFDTEIVTSHQLQFWGFEEDSFQMFELRSKKEDDRFYAELEKYLAGKPCDIGTDSSWMTRAEIAKQLVSQARELGEPWYKTVLLSVIQGEQEQRDRDEEDRRYRQG